MIAGSADDDMWAVSGATSSAYPPNANVAFHWDGRQWTNQSQGLPSGGGFDVIAASAAAGTWAIVEPPVSAPNAPSGSALVHWDGQRWQQVAFPPLFDPKPGPGALAVGPGDNVWVGGEIAGSRFGAPLAARYDGHAWRYYRLPHATSEGGRVTRLVVAGQATWALIAYVAPPPGGYQVLVPLTGGTASQLKIPGDQFLRITAMAGDPRSDLYLLTYLETVTGGIAVQRWDGHAWDIEPFFAPRKVYAYSGSGCVPPGSAYGKPGGTLDGLEISAIASVPGTTTAWAVGSFGGGGAALYPDCAQSTTQPVVEVGGPGPQH